MRIKLNRFHGVKDKQRVATLNGWIVRRWYKQQVAYKGIPGYVTRAAYSSVMEVPATSSGIGIVMYVTDF